MRNRLYFTFKELTSSEGHASGHFLGFLRNLVRLAATTIALGVREAKVKFCAVLRATLAYFLLFPSLRALETGLDAGHFSPCMKLKNKSLEVAAGL
jgi:hypothetical protein